MIESNFGFQLPNNIRVALLDMKTSSRENPAAFDGATVARLYDALICIGYRAGDRLPSGRKLQAELKDAGLSVGRATITKCVLAFCKINSEKTLPSIEQMSLAAKSEIGKVSFQISINDCVTTKTYRKAICLALIDYDFNYGVGRKKLATDLSIHRRTVSSYKRELYGSQKAPCIEVDMTNWIEIGKFVKREGDLSLHGAIGSVELLNAGAGCVLFFDRDTREELYICSIEVNGATQIQAVLRKKNTWFGGAFLLEELNGLKIGLRPDDETLRNNLLDTRSKQTWILSSPADELKRANKKLIPKRGYVYIVFSSGLYKIGKSINPKQRLASMQTSCPTTIEKIRIQPVKDMRFTERALHNDFFNNRVRGEWFAFDHQELARAIELLLYYAEQDNPFVDGYVSKALNSVITS